MRSRTHGILSILSGLLIYSTLGTVYAWSVFRKPVEELYQIGATQSGLPYMIFFVFFALSMPVSGRYIPRLGPKFFGVVGGLLVGAGWLLASISPNILVMTLGYGVISGLGVGMIYGAPIAVSARWFPERKGLAVGLTILGFGISPLMTAPLSDLLLHRLGPLLTFRTMGIFIMLSIMLLSLVLRFPAIEEVPPPKSGQQRDSSPAGLLRLIRDRRFIGLWLGFFAGALAGLMAIGISSPAGQELFHLNEETAALSVSVFALFNGLGRPLFGYLADRLGSRRSMLLISLIMTTASALLIWAAPGRIALFLIAFSLFWLVLGGWLGLAPAAAARLFGEEHQAENYGILFSAYGMGSIAGNLLSGTIRDQWGSYQPIFYFTLGLSILSLISAVVFLKQEHADS